MKVFVNMHCEQTKPNEPLQFYQRTLTNIIKCCIKNTLLINETL